MVCLFLWPKKRYVCTYCGVEVVAPAGGAGVKRYCGAKECQAQREKLRQRKLARKKAVS